MGKGESGFSNGVNPNMSTIASGQASHPRIAELQKLDFMGERRGGRTRKKRRQQYFKHSILHG